jgi:hypothetical protein
MPALEEQIVTNLCREIDQTEPERQKNAENSQNDILLPAWRGISARIFAMSVLGNLRSLRGFALLVGEPETRLPMPKKTYEPGGSSR